MADFNSGNIDLSIENTFDNVIMGNGDTMDFINAGNGGAVGAPILVTGDFTIGGTAVITLRNNANATPGTVAVLGIERNLNVSDLNYGTGGGGGAGGSGGSVGGGSGGSGNAEGDGSVGGNGYGSWSSPDPSVGGTAGAYSNGAGGGGGTGSAVTAGQQYSVGGGGGGGSAGAHGTSCENVSFFVQGNISITGGTINGAGVNGISAGGNGGGGGAGGTNNWAGGGGGGGAGGAGGHAGNLYLYHLGSAAEAFDTTNLDGGTGAAGGGGGAKGTAAGPAGVDGTAGTAGSAGGDGDDGVIELIEVDTTASMTTEIVKDIYALEAKVTGTIVNDGGNAITERGFVIGANLNPTTGDTKFIVAGLTTPFTETLTPLVADTTYHVRSYAINTEGTAYGDDIEFKTHKAFIPKSFISS